MTKGIVPAPHGGEPGREYALAVFRGMLGAVPYVGTLLVEVLFEARSRVKQRRLEEFISLVAERVGRLEERLIDREYLKSDEFSDLFEDICLRVSRTQSEAKRRRFAGLLVGAIRGQRDPDFTALFMGILAKLTEQQLVVLQSFESDRQRWLEEEGQYHRPAPWRIDYESAPWGFEGEVAKQIVQSLVARGLLANESHDHYDTTLFSVVVPTELGGRFMAWLAASEAEGTGGREGTS